MRHPRSPHELAELFRLAVFAEQGARGHDRNESASSGEEVPRMEHVIDVLLAREWRVHRDGIVCPARVQIQKVGSHDGGVFATVAQSMREFRLNLANVDEWPVLHERIGEDAGACGRLERMHARHGRDPKQGLHHQFNDGCRRWEEPEFVLGAGESALHDDLVDCVAWIAVEYVGLCLAVPLPTDGFQRLVDLDVQGTVELTRREHCEAAVGFHGADDADCCIRKNFHVVLSPCVCEP